MLMYFHSFFFFAKFSWKCLNNLNVEKGIFDQMLDSKSASNS